jgi:hypothetical protein
MTLPLSRRRLRVAFVFAVVVGLLGSRAAVPEPLPIALLAAFDEAFALASDAAEQRIAALELRPEAPRRSPCVAELLARVDRDVTAACEDARQAVERAIATVRLSPERRAAVLASIERQLAEAHRARYRTTDPEVRREYSETASRLRAIRARV